MKKILMLALAAMLMVGCESREMKGIVIGKDEKHTNVSIKWNDGSYTIFYTSKYADDNYYEDLISSISVGDSVFCVETLLYHHMYKMENK